MAVIDADPSTLAAELREAAQRGCDNGMFLCKAQSSLLTRAADAIEPAAPGADPVRLMARAMCNHRWSRDCTVCAADKTCSLYGDLARAAWAALSDQSSGAGMKQ